MSGADIGFKRMVVGLPQGPLNLAAVDAAADFAEFLNIELLATFVADFDLAGARRTSGARELRTLGQGWQPLDRAQITRDIDRAISVARRRFAESVRSRAIKTSFDVLTGAEAIASLIRFDDIVAVLEPAHPGEEARSRGNSPGSSEAAFEMAGAVLVVPRRIARAIGPIVTVAYELAARGTLFGAANCCGLQGAPDRRNASWRAPAAQRFSPKREQLGVQIEHIAVSGPLADASSLAGSPRFRERLRVLSRSVLTDDAARLFSSLQGSDYFCDEPVEQQLLLRSRKQKTITKAADEPVDQWRVGSSNSLQLDLGAIELVDHAFVHRIHKGTDAGGPGRALLPDLDPYVRACGAEARVVIDLINALVQAPAGFVTSSLTFMSSSPERFLKKPLQTSSIFQLQKPQNQRDPELLHAFTATSAGRWSGCH